MARITSMELRILRNTSQDHQSPSELERTTFGLVT